MDMLFSKALRELRKKKGLSQRELANQIFVARSTVARWENGSRSPDAAMITRLSECLGEDVSTLLFAAAKRDESPNVIMVDDRKIILKWGLPVLEEVLPNATIIGFTSPSEAIEHAKANRIALAFLDIELGEKNGIDLCSALLEINPLTNVVFLTAYSDYALPAWNTGASGFMLKPLTPSGIREQLKHLRHPFNTRGVNL